MSNSEDYLDGLLNSISQKKTDVEEAIDFDEKSIQSKIADMSSVDPNDDFMDATGISNYQPTKMSHDNLREAFSESDLLKEFEDELSAGSYDKFIDDFNREIDEEEAMFEKGEELPEDSGSEFVKSLLEEVDGLPGIDDADEEESDELPDAEPSEDFTVDEVIKDDVSQPESASENDTDDSIEDSFVTIDDSYFEENGEPSSEGETDSSTTEEKAEETTADDIEEDNDAIEETEASAIDDANELLSALGEETLPEESAEEAQSEGAPSEEEAEEDAKQELNDEVAANQDIQNILSEVENIVGDDTSEGDSNANGDAGESLLSEEFQSDEHDDIDALEVNEDGISLVDENADLDALLQGEDSDIGDLLNADENDIELDEARDTFEASADRATNATEDSSEDGGGEKKVGLIQKILGIFKKKKKENPEDAANELLNVAAGGDVEDTTKENEKILEELDEEEAEELAKKQEKQKKKEEKEAEKAAKKKEKEAAAAEKKAQKQAAKAEKAKKEKKPGKLKTFLSDDKSKKVPMKVIVIFVLLVATIVAVIVILSNLYNNKTTMRNFNASYSVGNYIEAYNLIAGLDGLNEEEKLMLNKARILADLQNKKQEYDTFMKSKDYQNALDALIVAVGRYNENLEDAKELGVNAEYNGIESMIVGQLMDQFGMTDEEAKQLYEIKGRTKYTITLNEKLKALGMDKSDSNN